MPKINFPSVYYNSFYTDGYLKRNINHPQKYLPNKYFFNFFFQVKPFCQWEKLDMTALERRKLLCSVTFHVVAITCVVWSLYVLIDRTAEEIRNGELQWPFWTKLVVVAIGFTGGLVFMYIQCKVYIHLCRKWKAYNRIIVVQVIIQKDTYNLQ